MPAPRLTFESVRVRPVVVPLGQPIVSRVGRFDTWPLILIDLRTREGVVGRSYLEPYLARAAALPRPDDRGPRAKRSPGQPVAPLDAYRQTTRLEPPDRPRGADAHRGERHRHGGLGRPGARGGVPLAVYLGGTVGPVPAYNSNGLWLTPVAALRDEAAALVAEGGFTALKLRLGRDRLSDDLAAIRAVREAAGEDVRLMVDFNQGLSLVDAIARCHALDDQGLEWFEEPIAYDNLDGYAQLARELDTPLQLGENFYGPRAMHAAIRAGAGDLVMPDLMRIGGVTGWMRAAAIAGAAGIPVSTHLYPETAAHLMRVTETAHWLEWQDWADPVLEEPYALRDGAPDGSRPARERPRLERGRPWRATPPSRPLA